VWDKEQDREIVLLTNHLKFGATTISAIYKDRWQIELFFKALKQNLKVKTFVGTSENALFIQIWTALIAMLLIKYLKFKSKFNWSLVQPGGFSQVESVYLQGFMGMDRQTVRCSSRSQRVCPISSSV
jgi:IS4 transposase